LTRYNDTVAMKFIPPMLSEVLRDPARLEDPRYVAEPKFDGQRAEVHVESSQTVAAYSRRSLDLLRHAGLAWLRDVRWAVSQAVLDGELCGDTGSDGIQSVLKARGRRDGVTSFVAFDLLQVAGEDLIREPWADRRKRLEDLGPFSSHRGSRSCPSPKTPLASRENVLSWATLLRWVFAIELLVLG
jgi:bifunctional non-homologous end joining protein LigD